MSRTLLAFFASTLLCSTVYAHCQVPCGIYGDQLRFERMLEDTKTITKAQGQINELAQAAKSGKTIISLRAGLLPKKLMLGQFKAPLPTTS